jgi:hypothetical protein
LGRRALRAHARASVVRGRGFREGAREGAGAVSGTAGKNLTKNLAKNSVARRAPLESGSARGGRAAATSDANLEGAAPTPVAPGQFGGVLAAPGNGYIR